MAVHRLQCKTRTLEPCLEHSHEYHDIFKKYEAMLASRIDAFLAAEGVTTEQWGTRFSLVVSMPDRVARRIGFNGDAGVRSSFAMQVVEECKWAKTHGHDDYKFYEYLVASVEYESFYKLMLEFKTGGIDNA
eukprot:6457707-Amphidinium_carterae.1